jgi:cytochrome P450
MLPFPPGPRDWVFGLTQFGPASRDMLGWFAGLQRTYGDTVGMRLGHLRYVVCFHPDQVREVLTAKARSFAHAPIVQRVAAQWSGNGLLNNEGESWKVQRRLIQTAFTHERLRDHAGAMVEAAQRGVERWLAGSGEIGLSGEMSRLTVEVIARTMFDTDLTSDVAAIGQVAADLSDIAMVEMKQPFLLPDWLPLPSIRRKLAAIRTLDEIVWRFVRARRAAPAGTDLLARMLSAVDEEGGGRMTDQQARDECTTLLLAGHDTTAAGLVWAVLALTQHPAEAARLTAEVDAVLGARPAEYGDVARLQHVERFVKECLRLWPPAVGAFPRQALEPVELGGFSVPAGAMVQLVSFITHRDARWFPEPERFDPDRWAPGRVDAVPKLAYFPFGAGPRVCIGMGFAMTELVLMLATMLQRVTFTSAGGPPQLAVRMSLRPAGDVRVRVAPRSDDPGR